MIVRKVLDVKLIFMVTWKRVATLLALSLIAVFAYSNWGHSIDIPDNTTSIVGTLLAILLGFRVNSAYERWWEARRLWGSIVNDSRSISREIQAYAKGAGNNVVRQMLMRQIAFAYATCAHLRMLPIVEKIAPFLTPDDLNVVSTRNNVPNAIIGLQANHVAVLHEEGIIRDIQQMQIEQRLTALTDSLGGCERIKKTVFPRDYSVYSSLFVTIFSFALPFTIVDTFGWQTVPWTLFIGFSMFSIDRLARAIEMPFENRFNDTPMNALCRTIEIDLLQLLGEEQIPEPLQPIDGYLL